MKRLLVAIQFLTIVPVRSNMTVSEDDVSKSVSFFVVVGLLQGLLLVATDLSARRIFHSDLVTGLVLLLLVLSNGGFHLDGLSDTFDALALKSEGNEGLDKSRRLAMMKTGTVGPMGVTAIFFALALKYLALNNVSLFHPFIYRSSLLLMPVISKWAMVVSMFHGKPARDDGLGRIFINKTGIKESGISTVILMLILISSELFFSRILHLYIPDKHYLFYMLLLPAIYFFCTMGIKFFDKNFGGLTGDVLGAISEITEIIFLFMVIIWSRFSI